MTETQSRRYASEVLNGQTVTQNGIVHTYTGFSNSMIECQKYTYLNEASFVAAECSDTSCTRHTSGIHIFAETESLDPESFEDNATIIRSEIQKVHKVLVPEIIFLKNGTLKDYSCKNCSEFHKFHLRDDYFSKKLANSIYYISRDVNEDVNDLHDVAVIETDPVLYCKSCFNCISNELAKPLNWRQFELLNEWFLEVPLELQIILTNIFVNKTSIRQSELTKPLVTSKLSRLYGLLEFGLNVYNRNYYGIIQQLNTEELIVNYHAVSTVFGITAQSGITYSRSFASKWLLQRADIDQIYFETFLKRYPLVYRSKDNEESTKLVCMRDCLPILYLDNLVRLRRHADPDPGQSRTSQLCTLPITVKGLPRDSIVTTSWHLEECDKEQNCICMDPCELPKSDIHKLSELSNKESTALTKFKLQVCFGVGFIDEELRSLVTECLDLECDEMVHDEQSVSEQVVDLNKSLHSMSLNDTLLLTTEDLELIEQMEQSKASDIESDIGDEELIPTTHVDEDEFLDGIENLSVLDADDGSVQTESESLTSTEHLEQSSTANTGFGHDNNTQPFLFTKFVVPPLLCRHPTPAEGRDDDINLLRYVLMDILTKLGRYPEVNNKERILFAPDHKISKNLIQLMKTDKRFLQFLPEFPILHLKKSKITNLFTAYKDAGILHLLKFMKDTDQEQDWMDLITLRNIETATRNIKRLSLAFHLAFLVKFISSLSDENIEEIIGDVESNNLAEMNKTWMPRLKQYLHEGSQSNATFALHFDMMEHCDEIAGISIAERIGGPEGYSLLLACIKSSLPFAFLNGATSYASFCVELLHIHYSAGYFHQNMKTCLFSTPHKDSTTNFALDTQREIDHQDAIKGFRPRATLQTVIPRMAVVDHFTEVQKVRKHLSQLDSATEPSVADKTVDSFHTADSSFQPNESHNLEATLNFDITEKDFKFILPLSRLILRTGALSIEKDDTPRNIYQASKPALFSSILDRETYSIGQFLTTKYACQQGLFQMTPEDVPSLSLVEGSKPVLQKLKSSKGVTVRRSTIKSKVMTEDEKKESKRIAQVKKQAKVIDCYSSQMNTCQALVKPDCSKASLQKSPGIRKALQKLLSLCLQGCSPRSIEENLAKEGLIHTDLKSIPVNIRDSVKYATVEFAGVKFKTNATSGDEYIQHIQKGVVNRILHDFPELKRMIICEEKYSFTPDDFKAATRVKRQKTSETSISHLKLATDIISDEKLTKSAVIHTDIGKRLISNYLARNVNKLDIKHDLLFDVDSELITRMQSCLPGANSSDRPYTVPIRAVFKRNTGFSHLLQLDHIRQRKGEAEMAQVDWLFEIIAELEQNESVISIVTSADIDSIVIHMFCLSLHWPRNVDGSFKNKVYVLLQKQKSELYDITAIIEILEKQFGRACLPNLSLALCIGGNDFLPKFYGLSHEKWLLEIIHTPGALNNIVQFVHDKKTGKPVAGTVNEDTFLQIVKQLYCPSTVNAEAVEIESVRQMSIKQPYKPIRHPTAWMPPKSALLKVVQLINCHIAYLMTVSEHGATLPDFLKYGCLEKDDKGAVQYNFGSDVKAENIQSLLTLSDDDLKAIMVEASKTRQKRPRSTTTTPVKPRRRKRRPLMSTPIKMKLPSTDQ